MPVPPEPLIAAPTPLAERYDVALLDLDGVVYIGPDAVRGAPQALRQARAAGMRLAFVTNNAARPPERVAAHLRELGIDADVGEIITSAQAAAGYLAEQLPPGAAVLVVGTDGLVQALTERGLRPVSSADDDPVAVVQGYSPTMDWALLAEGAVAVNRGALWVASNLDRTVPSPRGPLPGNGSLVAALRHATGKTPYSTGKPDPQMHRETVRRTGAKNPIVVGDRLDTDIEGANAVGCASLLVLTGVSTAADLLAASPELRPTYLAEDLTGLLVEHPPTTAIDNGVRCRAVTATAADGMVTVRHDGTGAADRVDVLRALCALRWGVATSGDRFAAGDERSDAALASLGLS